MGRPPKSKSESVMSTAEDLGIAPVPQVVSTDTTLEAPVNKKSVIDNLVPMPKWVREFQDGQKVKDINPLLKVELNLDQANNVALDYLKIRKMLGEALEK